MSFTCDFCHIHQFPGTKPVMVVTVDQARDYENTVIRRDPETLRTSTEIVRSTGWETRVEAKSCPACAGVAIKKPAVPDLKGYKLITRGCHAHVRGDGNKIKPCKARLVDECKVCKSIVAGFAAFPLHILTECLQDTMTKGLKTQMSEAVVYNAIARMDETINAPRNTRGVADFAAVAQVIKAWKEGA